MHDRSDPGLILVTGGAGFIGSFVCDQLLENGHQLRVIDRLDPQVHGQDAVFPRYLDPSAEFLHDDCSHPAAMVEALEGVETVIHLAAAVGVGQSMYEIEAYTRSNELATSVLLEALTKMQRRPKRLVVASSMSIYGEGRYVDDAGRAVGEVSRDPADLHVDRWEPVDADGQSLRPVPTDEEKPADVSSIYALGKYWQERASLITGGAYDIPTTALRFFNVYGPRQALSNPYTGVMAIFASRLLNDHHPKVYEDGRQRRDFVSVHDVADAVVAAAGAPAERVAGQVMNIGSGQSISIAELAVRLAEVLGKPDLTPQITGDFRIGDIRHCFADIGRARQRLGFEPAVDLEAGVAELAEWLADQSAEDRVDEAGAELAARGLTV
jgi:dTDP-L-rhamnose 4-epimerase